MRSRISMSGCVSATVGPSVRPYCNYHYHYHYRCCFRLCYCCCCCYSEILLVVIVGRRHRRRDFLFCRYVSVSLIGDDVNIKETDIQTQDSRSIAHFVAHITKKEKECNEEKTQHSGYRLY